jgi:hypothetical protein
VSIFGSVRFWAKINNQTEIIIFQVFEPNRKPVRTDHVQFGFFPCKPIQTEIISIEFFSGFFFTDHIFSGILFSYYFCFFLGFFIGHMFQGFHFRLVSIFTALCLFSEKSWLSQQAIKTKGR